MSAIKFADQATIFNFSQQLNLDRFIKGISEQAPLARTTDPMGKGDPQPSPGERALSQPSFSDSDHGVHGLWDHRWQPAAFIGETTLMLTGLILGTVETLEHQGGRGIQPREGHLALWTTTGLAGGAALGNLSCALLEVNNDYAQCDLIGGLLGSLASFFLADYLMPHGAYGVRRDVSRFIQVEMPPSLAQPLEPVSPIREGHRWPTDEYGP